MLLFPICLAQTIKSAQSEKLDYVCDVVDIKSICVFNLKTNYDLSPPPPHLSLKSCCRRLYNWLKVAPYRPDQQVEEDDDLMDENQGKGIRVLGVAYAPSRCVYISSLSCWCVQQSTDI